MSPAGEKAFLFCISMIVITIYLGSVIKYHARWKIGSLPMWLYYLAGGVYALVKIEIFLGYPTIGGMIANTGNPKWIFGMVMSSFSLGLMICCLISIIVLQLRASREAASKKAE